MRVVAAAPGTLVDKASLSWVAKVQMIAHRAELPARDVLEMLKDRIPERAQRIIKAAIDAGSTSGWGASLTPDEMTAQAGFIEAARSSSAFYEMLAAGLLRRTPLRTRFTLTTAGATGYIRGEGSAKPISKLALSNSTGLVPVEAVSVIVISDELIKMTSPDAQALFSAELVNGVGAAADERFIDILQAASGSTIASAGSTFEAAREDLDTLLTAVAVDKNSKLVFIGSPTVAKRASMLAHNGVWSFPEMTPTGGVMRGLPFLTSDGLDDDSLLLVDGNKIAANSDPIRTDVFREAILEMEDAPDSPETATTVQISLWQRNLAALVASAYIAAEALTDTAVAEITSIAWGDFSPDSPS